eukprot:2616731-Pleurochrysis_carterae.AAC.2
MAMAHHAFCQPPRERSLAVRMQMANAYGNINQYARSIARTPSRASSAGTSLIYESLKPRAGSDSSGLYTGCGKYASSCTI